MSDKFDEFKCRLTDGKYKNFAGACKGIGKVGLDSEDKVAARAFAAKFFKVEDPLLGKAQKGKRKAAKAAKTPKAAKAAKAAKTASGVPEKAKRGRKAVSAQLILPGIDAATERARYRVGTISEALSSMERAKTLGASAVDVQKGAIKAQQALTAIVEGLCAMTDGGDGSPATETRGTVIETPRTRLPIPPAHPPIPAIPSVA